MIRLVFFLFVLTLSGCSAKKQPAARSDFYIGKFSDQRGLDGCGWIIIADKPSADGMTKYEPVNLQDFNIEPREGMAVHFTYVDFEGNSVCMVGKLIKLTSLKPAP